ncbi:MAG: DUF7402 domain-containing protein [Thermoguttaceae bacterium]
MNRVLQTVMCVCVGVAAMIARADSATIADNLAARAKVSATSEFDGRYVAAGAVDGVIPQPLSRNDERRIWCVQGNESKNAAEFCFEWDEPVEVGEVIYFGRTSWLIAECFKDYAVYLDDNTEPVARGTFEARHGGQRITLTPQKVRKLRLKFLSAHAGAQNAGAAEIMVFAKPISESDLVEAFRDPRERTPQSQQLRRDVANGALGFDDVLVVHRFPQELSHVYVYHVEEFRRGGGLYVFSPDDSPEGGKLKCIVDSKDGMITSAQLSFDGMEVVFAWKRGGDERFNPWNVTFDMDRSNPLNNYQIYTVNIDGTNLRQLTNLACNNLDPAWLPDGGIVFISDRKPAYAYCWVTTSPVVYRMDRDGGNQKRLSANYLMDFTPSVLNDGRIIYTRWEYVDKPACPIQSLWAINPDGTGLAGFFGNRTIAPGTFMDAQPIPGSGKVICTATNHNGPCRGGIVVIDPSVSPNAGLTPETQTAVTNLTPEVDIFRHEWVYGNGLVGGYEKPFPIDENRFIVTKDGDVQVRSFDASAVATILQTRDGMGFYSAQPIRPRAVPPVFTGSTMNREVALPEDGGVSGQWATVFLQDVYKGLEPTVPRGTIKRIAVVQELEKSTHTPQNNHDPDSGAWRNIAAFGFQFPLVSCGATYSPKKLWGFADVAADGSAAFRVPSEVPIYFMALDAEGRAVQRMRTFTHLMPGEVQGCVGCHADRNMATPNRRERFLLSDAKVQTLREPAWGVKGFSYPEVVQPVFDKHCIECHNERELAGGVDMTGDMTDFFNVSYEHMARKGTQGERFFAYNGSPVGRDGDAARGESPYTSWIWTINGAELNILEVAPYRWGSPASKLAEILRSSHPDEHGAPRIDVSQSERELVYMWIDLNVPYYGTSSSNHKARMGSRRIYPAALDSTLKEVAARRCVSCHTEERGGVPRTFYTRILAPEKNDILLAPLAESAGGTQRCGRAIFATTDDPDYQAILKTFDENKRLLETVPRADMPNFKLLEQCEPPKE